MKKISNWSIAGFVVGAVWAIGTFWRYFVMYPDMDRAITYPIIGILICGLAFLYNRTVEQGNSIKAMEAYLSDKNFEEKYKGQAE
jgi:hypothetical protein